MRLSLSSELEMVLIYVCVCVYVLVFQGVMGGSYSMSVDSLRSRQMIIAASRK